MRRSTNAADGPNWVNSENWLMDVPPDEWYCIAVDGDGGVSGLRLVDNKLSGQMPPGTSAPGLEVLFSRGIPGASTWRR